MVTKRVLPSSLKTQTKVVNLEPKPEDKLPPKVELRLTEEQLKAFEIFMGLLSRLADDSKIEQALSLLSEHINKQTNEPVRELSIVRDGKGLMKTVRLVR